MGEGRRNKVGEQWREEVGAMVWKEEQGRGEGGAKVWKKEKQKEEVKCRDSRGRGVKARHRKLVVKSTICILLLRNSGETTHILSRRRAEKRAELKEAYGVKWTVA